MSDEMQVFQFDGGAPVRVRKDEHGEPWFVAKDVAEILGYRDAADMTRRIDDDEKGYTKVRTLGGEQQMAIINESGLYQGVFCSSKPEAKNFRKWVTGEVLPMIRKTGGYMVAKADDTPESIMARAVLIAQETINRQKQQLEAANSKIDEQQKQLIENAPKVLFAETFSVSKGLILIRDFAKMLQQSLGLPDFGQHALYCWLKGNGYMNSNRYPSDYAEKMQLLHVTEGYHQFSDGSFGQHHTTRITGKGQTYFFNKIKDQYDKQGRWW